MGIRILTVPEMAILLRLAEGSQTEFDLAQTGRLSTSEIPKYLSRLERRGLISHDPLKHDPTDRWKLTDRGVRLRNVFVHSAQSTSDPGVLLVDDDLDHQLGDEELDAALDRAIRSAEK